MRSRSDAAPHAILVARVGDVGDAAAMAKVAYAPDHIPHAWAAAQCERIVGEPFGFSVVVTRQVGRGAPRVVGVQNGILLAPWFSEALLVSGRPYVHDRIREAERNPFPTEPEVAHANAKDGLHFLLAHFALHPDLDPAEAIRVRGLMVSTFSEFFGGNRVRSILVETGGEGKRTAQGAGFQTVRDYGGPCLLGIDLARALEVQNFHLARLLDYRPPFFRFSPLAREALRLAIQGVTDAQATARYGITSASLASRWSRILDTVDGAMPELFETAKGKRSRDRLPLLAYVRAHPEELWPYDPT